MFQFVRNLYLHVEWILRKESYKSCHNNSINTSKRYPYFCVPKRIRFRDFARATVSLPLGGFIFCVLWTLWADFDATDTHCKAKNFLPSISAAVSHSKLSDNVWKLCIGLHAIPRLFVAAMYNQYLSSIVNRRFLHLVRIACLMNVVENMALVGLTFVTSKQNYEWHKRFFIIFIISFELYTSLMVGLLKRCRRHKPSKLELQSFRVKCQMMVIQVFSLIIGCYTFHRHNRYCENYMYTLFAFFEYIVVLANIGFHMTAYWDFYDRVLTLTTSHEEKSEKGHLSHSQKSSLLLLPQHVENYSIDINNSLFEGVIYK